jgi:ferredoxin
MPVGFPATESGIELKLLRHLFSPQQAELALFLSALPEPFERIRRRAGKLGLNSNQLKKTLDEMNANGLIRKQRDSKGKPTYAKLMLAVGIYEMQVSRLTKELEELFTQYGQEAFGKAFVSRKTTQLRTVPVDVRLTPDRKVGTYDDARELITQSKGPFAIIDCICKKGQELLGEPCKQTHYSETCLTIGSIAERTISKGVGRKLTREQTLALLDRADADGLVVQPQNTQDPSFICFCCGCCCHVLRISNRFPEPASYFSANYFAKVDPDLCIGCGTCSSRCQMDAIYTDNTESVVDLGRCIGCGLCVSTCPSEALSLERKEASQIPPKDENQLYTRILQERYGPLGTAKVLGKKILRMKI